MRDVEGNPRSDAHIRALCKALAQCAPDEDLLLRFLRDLLTVQELQRAAARWAVARSIDEGKSPEEVAAELHVSRSTAARVRKSVVNGTGGFRAALERWTNGGEGRGVPDLPPEERQRADEMIRTLKGVSDVLRTLLEAPPDHEVLEPETLDLIEGLAGKSDAQQRKVMKRARERLSRAGPR